jgi:hypothetical protein
MSKNILILILLFIPFLTVGQILDKELLTSPEHFGFGFNYKIVEFEDRYILANNSNRYYSSSKSEILWDNYKAANDDFIISDGRLFYVSEFADRETYCSGKWYETKYGYLISTDDQGISYDTLITEKDTYSYLNEYQQFFKGRIYKGNDEFLYWMPYSFKRIDNEDYYFPKAYLSNNGGANWSKWNYFYSQTEFLSNGHPFLGDDSDARLRDIVVMNNDTSLMVDGNSKFIYSDNPYFTNYEIKQSFHIGLGNRTISNFEYNSNKDILYGFSGNKIFKSLNKGKLFTEVTYDGSYIEKFENLYCFQDKNVFNFYEEIESIPTKTIELDTAQFEILSNKQFSAVNDSVFTAIVNGKNFITRDFGNIWKSLDKGKFRIPGSVPEYRTNYFELVGDEILHGKFNTPGSGFKNNTSYIGQEEGIDYSYINGNEIQTLSGIEVDLYQSRIQAIGENLFAIAITPDDDENSLYISEDKGETWKFIFKMNNSLFYPGSFYVNSKSVFVVLKDNLYRSSNNGMSWDSLSFASILPEGLDSFEPNHFESDGQHVLLSYLNIYNIVNKHVISKDDGLTFDFIDSPNGVSGRVALGNNKIYFIGTEGQIFEENIAGGWDQIVAPFDFLTNCSKPICRVVKFNATNGFIYIELQSQYTESYTCEVVDERRYFISSDNGETFHSCENLNLDKYKDGYFYYLEFGLWRMNLRELYKYTADSLINIDLCDSRIYENETISNDTLIIKEVNDSIFVIEIEIHDSSSDTINYTICDIDSLLINDTVYSEEGVYLVNQVNYSNSTCDSILTYANISVLSTNSKILHDTICNGDTLFIADSFFTESNLYLLTEGMNIHGCDSIEYLQLEILENFHDTLEIQILAGEIYNDVVINSDTTWSETYLDKNGCKNSTTHIVSILTSLDGLFNASEDIIIFPNPFSNYVYIEFIETINSSLEVQIIGSNGQIYHEGNYKSFEVKNGILRLDLIDIPTGLLFAKIVSENKYYLAKLNHM